MRIALDHVLAEPHLLNQLHNCPARDGAMRHHPILEHRLTMYLAYGHGWIERAVGVLEDYLERAPVALQFAAFRADHSDAAERDRAGGGALQSQKSTSHR